MGRRAKRAGNRWERESADELSEHGGEWKRIPGSGALASLAKVPMLGGDLVGKYPWFEKNFRGEAKYGYGGSKQMTLKREWFQKIQTEADRVDDHPCVILKFKNVTTGDSSAKIICFSIETWNELMEELEDLWYEYQQLLEKVYGNSE